MIASSRLGHMWFAQEWTSVLKHFCTYRSQLKSFPKSMSGTSQTWARMEGAHGMLALLQRLGNWEHSHLRGRDIRETWPWQFWKGGPCPSLWACFKLPHNEVYFGSNTPKLTCSEYHIRRCTVLICPISGLYFDPLMKGVSTRFPHYEVTDFPLSSFVSYCYWGLVCAAVPFLTAS